MTRGLIDTHTDYRELHAMFHRLWSKAVGTPDYVKSEWMDFDNALVNLARRAPPLAGTDRKEGT